MRSPGPRGLVAAGAACAALAACGGAGHSADDLHEALLEEFEDSVLSEDQSESGTYAELASVQAADELRDEVEADNPECLDAGREWGQLDEVRSAEAAMGLYGRDQESITHVLLDITPEVAEEALASRTPEECRSYEVTNANGDVHHYTTTPLDLELDGTDSHAYLVEAEIEESVSVLMYSLVYDGDGYLGMTTVMGAEAQEETLADFAEAARRYEEERLG
jgi:hypothetical protein